MVHKNISRCLSVTQHSRALTFFLIGCLVVCLSFVPYTSADSFGNSVVGSQSNYNSPNRIVAVSFNVPVSCTVESISVYMAYTTSWICHVKYAIYSDSANYPSVLLASTGQITISSSVNPGPAWQTLPLTSPATITAGKYWLVWWQDTYFYCYSVAGAAPLYSDNYIYGSFPSTLNSADFHAYGAQYNIFANYTINPPSFTAISSNNNFTGTSTTYSSNITDLNGVSHYMWCSNSTGQPVNGSWAAWSSNPVSFTETSNNTGGVVDSLTLYANNSLGYVSSVTNNFVLTAPYLLVSLNSPEDRLVINGSYNVLFSYVPTLIAAGEFSNSTLMVNSIPIMSNQSAIINGTANYFNYTFNSNGTYSWNVQVWNTSASVLAPENFVLWVSVIDTSAEDAMGVAVAFGIVAIGVSVALIMVFARKRQNE